MGLLDFMQTPQGIGLLSAVAGGMAGARRNTPWNNAGRGLVAGLTGYTAAQDQIRQDAENKLMQEYKALQMQQIRDSIAAAQAQKQWRAGLPAKIAESRDKVEQFTPDDPFNEGAATFGQLYGGDQHGQQASGLMANVTPGNPQALQEYLMQPDSPYADKILEKQLFPKDPEYKEVGGTLVQIGANGVNPVFTAPKEVDYNKPFLPDGTPNTDYQQWKLTDSKAGAANVTNRIENKLGESIAGQVGPMLKDSKERTTGAINLANSSRMMVDALDRGSAYVGPMANARLKMAQVGQMLGVGGKTEAEKINNTRQLIRGLAEGAVEARKELAGQGQVTESEAAAVQKAYSGNIEDLTANEIRLIAGLNIKRERLARQRHQQMMRNAPGQLQPFYQVDEEAPTNSNGGWSIRRK